MNTAPCPLCAAPMTYTPNEPFVLNTLGFSQITVVHEQGITCPACDAYFIVGIKSANIEYSLSPVPRPSGLITALSDDLRVLRGLKN